VTPGGPDAAEAHARAHSPRGLLIRRETAADRPAVYDLLADAFASATDRSADPAADPAPGSAADPAAGRARGSAAEPVEVELARRLFQCPDYLPRLSLVAEQRGGICGFVICTRGSVGDPARPALGLGPLAVLREGQRQGTGTALMHAVIGAADALDEPLIALLGHTSYYPRFGFRPASELGLEAPDPAWGDHFQARTLSAYSPALRGHFRYAAPFAELS
jgi:predicted N-acetyltransferase YhbS